MSLEQELTEAARKWDSGGRYVGPDNALYFVESVRAILSRYDRPAAEPPPAALFKCAKCSRDFRARRADRQNGRWVCSACRREDVTTTFPEAQPGYVENLLSPDYSGAPFDGKSITWGFPVPVENNINGPIFSRPRPSFRRRHFSIK